VVGQEPLARLRFEFALARPAAGFEAAQHASLFPPQMVQLLHAHRLAILQVALRAREHEVTPIGVGSQASRGRADDTNPGALERRALGRDLACTWRGRALRCGARRSNSPTLLRITLVSARTNVAHGSC
jgi:hypothetical protein